MARGLYVVDQLGPIDVANRPAVSTFTASQDIYGAPQKILPKSRMDVGMSLDLEAWGEYSSLTGAALTLGFGLGAAALGAASTTLAATSIFTTGTTPAAWMWHMHWMGSLQVIGTGAAGGTFQGQGTCDLGSSLTAMSGSPMPITSALRTVTFDCTADRALNVLATWGASSASNTITVHKFYAKVMS